VKKRNEYDVLVVGGGPTAIAALYECKERNLRAVALESGSTPLAAIQAYPEGLIFSSPASHFEIDGLPLDCKDFHQITREEVLFYYERIVNLKKLDIACDTKVVSIKTLGNSVSVTCQTPRGKQFFNAKHLLISAWFSRSPLRIENWRRSAAKLVDMSRNNIGFANKKVVVVGSGLSSCETAMSLMLAGHSVDILLRGEPHALHAASTFNRLVSVTGSRLIAHVKKIEGHQCGLEITVNSTKQVLPCDIVVRCTGQRTDPKILKILCDSGIISKDVKKRLKSLVPAEKQLRKSCGANFTDGIASVVKQWPDLSAFFPGRLNVHFVGGILHVGSSSAGVKVSIYSARTLVKLISGRNVFKVEGTLAKTLYEWSLTSNDDISFTSIQDLRPMRVRSWSRNQIPLTMENDFGQSKIQGSRVFETRPIDSNEKHEILKLSDGNRSIRQIVRVRMKHGSDPAFTVKSLYSLFYTNALTWLPPTSK
jgi:thioredoxin reductase